MRLEIVSGQPEANVNDFFGQLLAQYGVSSDTAVIFPEYEKMHPKKLYKKIRKITKQHIEENADLFILTYSELALYAVRTEIRRHQFEGAVCHQILNDGTDMIADISKNGYFTVWAEDVLDVLDMAMIKLVESITNP